MRRLRASRFSPETGSRGAPQASPSIARALHVHGRILLYATRSALGSAHNATQNPHSRDTLYFDLDAWLWTSVVRHPSLALSTHSLTSEERERESERVQTHRLGQAGACKTHTHARRTHNHVGALCLLSKRRQQLEQSNRAGARACACGRTRETQSAVRSASGTPWFQTSSRKPNQTKRSMDDDERQLAHDIAHNAIGDSDGARYAVPPPPLQARKLERELDTSQLLARSKKQDARRKSQEWRRAEESARQKPSTQTQRRACRASRVHPAS